MINHDFDNCPDDNCIICFAIIKNKEREEKDILFKKTPELTLADPNFDIEQYIMTCSRDHEKEWYKTKYLTGEVFNVY